MNNKYIDIYNDIFTALDTQDLIIKESFLMKSIDIDDVKKNLINLLDSEYVIFPTNHFFHKLNPSVAFFEKTKITCINYYIRYEILSKINMINKIIKSEDKKYDKIKDKNEKIDKLKIRKDIHKKINSISVDISDSTIKLVQFSSPATNITTFPGALFPNYQVYLFDSTDLQKVPIVNLLLNTDTILTDKKLTFTIHFGGPVPPPSLPPAPFCPPNSVTDCFCGTYAGTKKCNKTGTIYGSCVYPYMGDVSSC